MNTFEFGEYKPGVYRLVIRSSKGDIVDILERWDPRGRLIAKLGIFSFVNSGLKDFNNPNIDRLLFL